MMRGALAVLLNLEPDLEVVAEVSDGQLIEPEALAKDGPAEQLATAIRQVRSGATVVDPELARDALRHAASPLTEREREVLAAAEHGASILEIAERLSLSSSTVRNYLSSAISKTGTRNKTEAAHVARLSGWL